MSVRSKIVDKLDAAGVGDQARAARRVFAPSWARRNFKDDQSLHLFIRLTLAQNSRAVDVGANVGTILEQIVRAAPAGQHIAYEPVPFLADDLSSKYPTVDVRRKATSDEVGEASFTIVPGAHSRSGLQAMNDATGELITVEVTTLDSDIKEKVDFLKIDVEGAELETLRGARRILHDYRPFVAFEHGHGLKPADLPHNRAIFDELSSAGLRICDMDGVALDRQAFEAVYLSGDRWNFLARP